MQKPIIRVLICFLICTMMSVACKPDDPPAPPAPENKTAAEEPGQNQGQGQNGNENGQGENNQGENGQGENGQGENGQGENGQGENGQGENGQGENGQESGELYPDDENAPAAPAGPFKDLGASGTSNCYIISAPGTYKFKAVKGKTTTIVGTVAKAVLLWETCNTSEAVQRYSVIESVGVDGSYITFKTPSPLVPGNALIAAKDASGKVLWSWHIWIPATEITSDTYSLSSYKMMSRNLGALVDAEAGSSPIDVRAMGLHYQWGRKDPFPGAGTSGGSDFAAVAGFAMTFNDGSMSMEDAIAKPTYFAGTSGDWCTVTNGDYWGDTSGSKSMYDPCPAGYKVPKREDATGIFRTNLTEATNWKYNESAHWFTAGDPAAVFALPGYIDVTGVLNGSGSKTDIWNAHHDKDVPGKAYGQYVYEGPKSIISAQTKARGGSVRCVSEKLEPFTNAEGMPVQGSYTRYVFGSDVEELSGICFSKDKDFFWAVGDEGAIYQISLDMKMVTTVLATGSDLEDVTIHPTTNDLYFAKEADRVDKFAAPGYNKKTQCFYVDEAKDFGNSGLEGIAYYKDDILYIGAQTGATLWAYKIDGTRLWKKQLGTIAPQIEEVGGLCYDAEKDWLWVTDSEAHKLFVFNGEVTKLLAIYNVDYIGNNESILVDRANGVVYVGDDGSTSKIYTISFSNL